ncbi:UDP-2,3-diacylglucosamine diphosphatase LpxI [Candidatus Poribacteria bacterium]|nr:UDP-2,3-diacylglucosamine diphosphatase LpxI [Candidatus Poribacteria bacterium]
MSTGTGNAAAGLPPVIGLIAGEGDFPVLLAQGAVGAGVSLVVFGVHGLASDNLRRFTEHLYSLKLTDVSRLFELCHKHNVRHLVMAGRVPHKLVLKQISFDSRVLKILGNLRNKKADSLLRAATEEIEKEGIEVLDSTMFLKSCMPEAGLLTPACPPNADVQKDIEFGYPIAKQVARLDIGQTIVVKNQLVVAVEGIEGTDELIRRSGELVGTGVVVVKVSKPRQDMRFDVPVIGRKTIEGLIAVKAAALCVTAKQSLFFDREESVRMAQEKGISLVAYQETGNESAFE